MSELGQKAPMGALAKKLVQIGLLKEAEANSAMEGAAKQGIPLVSYLVQNRLVDQRILAITCSKEFGLPLFDVTALNPESIPINLVKAEVVVHHHALPIFRRGNRLFVAVSDPTNYQALDDIKVHSSLQTEAILAEEQKLSQLIDKAVSAYQAESLGGELEESLETIDISAEEEGGLAGPLTGKEADEAPIVRYINKMLLEAVNTGASDLHFEPYEKYYRIRFRQDGILYEHATPPVALGPRLTSRLKVMARLDISERRIPQDGRFKMKISPTRTIDFRMSTCPTLYGEKVVLRVLDPSSSKLDIEILGFEDFQKAELLKAISKPQGMILVTGPTGSGKTVTLYTSLNILNKTDINISTCEDPVEINLPGINQVHVNVKAGLTFATALRAFLRQDPDVIMVGEIRDLETAEIAVKAAQTGHLVLSTLHTNSAADTLNRLINMGIPSYNLATSVNLVMAQRLVRILCPECKVPISIPEPALKETGFTPEEIPTLQLFGPKGCDKCKEGYRGRQGIYEVLPVTNSIADIIMKGGDAIQIYKTAISEGMWDLRKSGLNKVKLGLTSLEELNQVTKE